MLPHPLINMEIQRHYQNEPRFNGVYFHGNLLHKTSDGAYVINVDEYADIDTYWIAFHVNGNNVTYLNNSAVEHILRKIKW